MEDNDLSPYAMRDTFTLAEAADLWAGLLPSARVSEKKAFPHKRALAREWLKLLLERAKAGSLPAERHLVTTAIPARLAAVLSSDPWLQASDTWCKEFGSTSRARQQTPRIQQVTVPCIWEHATVTRAALQTFASTIGQRPAFLFPAADAVRVQRAATTKSPPQAAGASPPDAWSRGLKLIAYDAARRILADGERLTGTALLDAMTKDDKVRRTGDRLEFVKASGSLARGEDEIKETTVSKDWRKQLETLLTAPAS